MTTASSATGLPFGQNRFLQALCAAMGLVLLASAWHSVQAFDWWLESALALVFLMVLACTYRKLALSDLSYLLIFIFIGLHEWGAHHKYASVPLGEWMKPWFGTTRNDYDRLMHFAYGLLLAYPMQEWFVRSAGVRNGFRYFLPIQFTLACSAVYEILESWTASVLSPAHGQEFVGMQGDIWDAQNDMFVAAIGAALAMAMLAWVRAREGVPEPAGRPVDRSLHSKESGRPEGESGLRA
ncbi:MAG: DUF2238 domain-containing protein [Acidobacteriota bacterium]